MEEQWKPLTDGQRIFTTREDLIDHLACRPDQNQILNFPDSLPVAQPIHAATLFWDRKSLKDNLLENALCADGVPEDYEESDLLDKVDEDGLELVLEAYERWLASQHKPIAHWLEADPIDPCVDIKACKEEALSRYNNVKPPWEGLE